MFYIGAREICYGNNAVQEIQISAPFICCQCIIFKGHKSFTSYEYCPQPHFAHEGFFSYLLSSAVLFLNGPPWGSFHPPLIYIYRYVFLELYTSFLLSLVLVHLVCTNRGEIFILPKNNYHFSTQLMNLSMIISITFNQIEAHFL